MVSNSYGVATSTVAVVSANVMLNPANNLVADSNPANTERDGLNNGATWVASSFDGIKTRSGVMQFVGTNANSITVAGTSNLDAPAGSVSLWMRSAGTDPNASGSVGAAIFGQSSTAYPGHGVVNNEFELIQQDGGSILFTVPGNWVQNDSSVNVSDDKWHLIAVTYDSSTNGGASLYIDGALDLTNSNFGGGAWTLPTGKPFEASFSRDGVLRAFNGLLDDIRIYNRQLTASEVASIYNAGALIDTTALQMQITSTQRPSAVPLSVGGLTALCFNRRRRPMELTQTCRRRFLPSTLCRKPTRDTSVT